MRTLSLIGTLAFAALAPLAAGCFPKAGPAPAAIPDSAVDTAKLKFPEATVASLEEGRQIFLGKCSSCHEYPDLNAEPEDEWQGIIHRMAAKAELTDDQKQKVYAFVIISRTSPGDAAAPAGSTAPAAPAATGTPATPPASATPAASGVPAASATPAVSATPAAP